MTIQPYSPGGQYQPNPELALHTAISSMTAQGFRVESMTGRSVVMLRGKECNHTLHLLLTLATCLLWAPIWMILGLTMKVQRVTMTVDEQGRVFTAASEGVQ